MCLGIYYMEMGIGECVVSVIYDWVGLSFVEVIEFLWFYEKFFFGIELFYILGIIVVLLV